MQRTIAIAGAAVIITMIGGIWLATLFTGPKDQFAACRTTAVAGGVNQIGGPFELLNSKGEVVTDKDVITGPSLLYFGYTFCPDVCPLDNARNAEAIDLLEDNGTLVTPIFISIDPARDTPEVVGDYAKNLHERMIGLTGSAAQVKVASQAYKTYYKAQPADDDYYLVDHTTFSYLVLPEHGFLQYFRRDTSAEVMAEQIACFVDNQ